MLIDIANVVPWRVSIAYVLAALMHPMPYRFLNR